VLAWMMVFVKLHTVCTIPYIENSRCCQIQISDCWSSILFTARTNFFNNTRDTCLRGFIKNNIYNVICWFIYFIVYTSTMLVDLLNSFQ
jgi:hypothetical protein